MVGCGWQDEVRADGLGAASSGGAGTARQRTAREGEERPARWGKGNARRGEARLFGVDMSIATKFSQPSGHDPGGAANDDVFGSAADDEVYSEQQVADRLQISVRDLRGLFRRGEMGFMPVTVRKRRVTKRQFDEYIARKEAEGSCEQTLNRISTGATTSSTRLPAKAPTKSSSAGTTPEPSNAGLELLANAILRKHSRR